jgi:predicted PurR-regulated permease PerM
MAVVSSVLALTALISLMNGLASLVTLLVLAVLLTYLLQGPVAWMNKGLTRVQALLQGQTVLPWRLHPLSPAKLQALAVLLVMLSTLAAVLVGLAVGVPLLLHELTALLKQLPTYYQTTLNALPWLTQNISHYLEQLPWLKNLLPKAMANSHSLTQALLQHLPNPASLNVSLPPLVADALAGLSQQPQGEPAWGAKAQTWLGQSVGHLLQGVALVLLTTYFLKDGETLVGQINHCLPVAFRPVAQRWALSLHRVLRAFIQGQVLLGLLTGVFMAIVYSVFSVPYALVLASTMAVAELIPVVGTWLGLTPALLVAGVTLGPLPTFYVWVSSYVYQTVKDNVLQPRITGTLMGLHPFVVLVALLIGAKFGGLLGVVVALPLVSWLLAVAQDIGQQLAEPATPSSPTAEAVAD